MSEPGPERVIRNIREYPSGLIVCLDQDVKRIDEFFGPREKVLPKLQKTDLSQARIKRLVQKNGKTFMTQWVEVSQERFFFSK